MSPSSSPTSIPRRNLILAGTSLLFGILLIGSLWWFSQQAQAPVTPTSSPATQAPPTPLSPSQGGQIVALVNGAPIALSDARQYQDMDRVMGQIMGMNATTDTQDILERLINRSLLLQAAARQSFHLPPEQMDAAWQRLLQRAHLTKPELRQALQKQNIDWQTFLDYVDSIILTNAFATQQAQALGITPAQYIDQLQRQAQISFGPAAQALLTPPTPPSTPTPPHSPASLSTSPTPPPQHPTPSPPSPKAQIGSLAPDFTLPLAQSPNQTLTLSQLQGQPVVLSFWTTWCPYCQRQTPILIAAYETYSPNITFLGIDVQESVEHVQSYLNEQRIPYPILLDEQGQVAAWYQVRGFPTTYFLNPQGTIVDIHIGALAQKQLETYLQPLLQPAGETP